jgi:hypothetical protein
MPRTASMPVQLALAHALGMLPGQACAAHLLLDSMGSCPLVELQVLTFA